MEIASVQELFSASGCDSGTVYVAPLIPQTDTDTSYLYQLYASEILKEDPYVIRSVSFWGHWKPVLHSLFSRKVIFHYHWLEFQQATSLAGLPYKLLAIFLFRLFGGKLIWTVHNEAPHLGRYPRLHQKIYKWMFRKADILHLHCKSAVERLRNWAPELSHHKIRILKHPDFPVIKTDKDTAIPEVENLLGIPLKENTPVWLIYGQISPYKQLPQLLEVLLKADLNIQVIVAGTIKRDGSKEYEHLVKLMEHKPNFKFIPRWISDVETQMLFSVADLCLFNHREIFASGSMYLALSYGVPLLAPAKGCITESSSNPHVHLFENPQQLDQLIMQLSRGVMHE